PERARPAAPAPRERTSPAPAPRAADMAVANTAPAAAPAATGTVFAQADLPEAVRAQLPSLKISGVTYSSNPVYRMAIVNGQVLHEGDPAGPGLLLEKIEPGRTIWSFKGYRYGLASQ
uniref:general secretion pathway protein GspB n=1 Tax=uncultured Acidovorax sp. TaxID=158751 RepID=UPI0025FDD21B